MLHIFKRPTFFDSIAKYAIGILLFLLPLAFSPLPILSNASVKYAVLFTLTTVAALAYMIARVIDKKYVLPHMIISASLASLPIVFLISALFTGRLSDSFIGYGYESTTVLSILLLVTLAFLASVYGRDGKSVTRALKLVAASAIVVFVYQLVRLFVPADWVTLGSFNGPFANLIEKWNDLAIYFGAVLISLYVLAKNTTSKKLYILVALAVLVLLFLNVISFTLVWPVLAATLLLVAIFDSIENNKITLFSKKGLTPYRRGVLVFVGLVVVYMLVVAQAVRLNSQGALLRPNLNKIVNVLPNLFGGTPGEARPSALVTAKVFVKEIKSNPVFGSGPNRFVESWMQYRPAEIMQTQYWNTGFNFGFSYFGTLIISTGVLGLFAIVFFLLCTTVLIVRMLRGRSVTTQDKIIGYTTLYLLVFSVLYVPSIALLVYMFLGVGYMASRAVGSEFSVQGKLMNIAVLVKLALTVVLFVLVATMLFREYASAAYFAQARRAVLQDKNIDLVDTLLVKAIRTRAHDVYYRTYAELASLKAQVIVSEGTKNNAQLTEEARTSALAQVTLAEKYAEAALQKNSTNYSNYIFAAGVYESNPEKVEKAIDLYNQSLAYNPNNPDVYFGIARIKAAKGDLVATKEYIQKTLTAKPNYTNALLAAAQLAAQDKDIEGTIQLLARAYQSDVARSDILLNIANIQFDAQKDIKSATQTLEIAVGRNPNYLEGRYGLAVLYARQNKFEDAANLLTGIIKLDEKTKTVLDPIIEKLRAGTDPFVQSAAPAVKTATSTKQVIKATTTKVKK